MARSPKNGQRSDDGQCNWKTLLLTRHESKKSMSNPSASCGKYADLTKDQLFQLLALHDLQIVARADAEIDDHPVISASSLEGIES